MREKERESERERERERERKGEREGEGEREREKGLVGVCPWKSFCSVLQCVAVCCGVLLYCSV